MAFDFSMVITFGEEEEWVIRMCIKWNLDCWKDSISWPGWRFHGYVQFWIIYVVHWLVHFSEYVQYFDLKVTKETTLLEINSQCLIYMSHYEPDEPISKLLYFYRYSSDTLHLYDIQNFLQNSQIISLDFMKP